MRLIKTFGLAALAAVAAMAFVGATSASATSTQLCKAHGGLTCTGGATGSVHQVLAPGTVGELLAAINVLCLGVLVEATALGLGNPQSVHSTSQTFSGCGTGSAHNNCTVTVEEQPLLNLLKTGLDEGVLTATNGALVLKCANLFLNCLIHLTGAEFVVGANHLTANETRVAILGGFTCPDEGLLDWLLETLTDTFVLG